MMLLVFFFFNDTATTEIYTLSLHDALPIFSVTDRCNLRCKYCMPEEEYTWLPRETILSFEEIAALADLFTELGDRKSTRLNSSHDQISYAVFCLKKKNEDALVFRPTKEEDD